MQDDFEAAAKSATIANFRKQKYFVELLDNGTYQLFGTEFTENSYQEFQGLVLTVPPLSRSEYHPETGKHDYENARKSIVEQFERSQQNV